LRFFSGVNNGIVTNHARRKHGAISAHGSLSRNGLFSQQRSRARRDKYRNAYRDAAQRAGSFSAIATGSGAAALDNGVT
jgi:hypothetical protein